MAQEGLMFKKSSVHVEVQASGSEKWCLYFIVEKNMNCALQLKRR